MKDVVQGTYFDIYNKEITNFGLDRMCNLNMGVGAWVCVNITLTVKYKMLGRKNESIKELRARGQKIIESDLFGPQAFNKWRSDVISKLEEKEPDGDVYKSACTVPRASEAKNRHSGRGLKRSDQLNVIKLIKILDQFNISVNTSEVPVDWLRVFNRLFELINIDGPCYFSGVRFISVACELDPYFPDYEQYIEKRRAQKKSTSRKRFFYDILMELPEERRAKFIMVILDQIGHESPDLVAGIRDELGGESGVPLADVVAVRWDADRLQAYLSEIDTRIKAGKYESSLTLCYTCVEGFLKAFLKNQLNTDPGRLEIVSAGKIVQKHLKKTIPDYPDEALRMINHICHTIDRARNGFSESHFDSEASRWLAIFMRDLANSLIRLLLHFITRPNIKFDDYG